ncbi:Chaperone protein DnaJ, partial [Glycine soja]
MECNKDEGLRARQIAGARTQRGEFVEALKFATKAKNIPQIITVCEVHIPAQKNLSGSEMDWYAILQIERLADEATLKKQYWKLALLLHPDIDKNKFVGEEAAFMLIGEANGVLSDQTKCTLYDIKFGAAATGAAPKTSHHYSNGNVFDAKHNANATNNQKSSGSCHFSNGNVFAAKYDAKASVHQKNSYPNSTGFNNQAGQMIFWTSCQHCNAKYQFLIRFVNAYLLCQQCKKPFKKLMFKDGYVPASRDMMAQTSKNVGSKRARQATPDSGEILQARNGNLSKFGLTFVI